MKNTIAIILLGIAVALLGLNGIYKSYEIRRLTQVVEILGYEADAVNTHMRDSNIIDMKIIKRLKALEAKYEAPDVQ